MNRQAELAREWAEQNYPEWVKIAEGTLAADLLEKAKAAAEYILATTEPEIPELNRWDGVEVYGREWIVWSVSETGELQLLSADGGIYAHDFAENVTPNGKRYKLVEATVSQDENVADDQPDHPEYLETEEDYWNAPVGTVVSRYGMAPWWKKDNDTWCRFYDEASNELMASKLHTFKVLRWGEQA